MKTSLLILFLTTVLFSVTSTAQTHVLQGLLTENNEPASYFDVQLIASDTVIQSQTDEKGLFYITATEGTYQLQVLYFDTTVYEQNVLLSHDIDLGTIVVETSNQLSEMVIETSKKLTERTPDRFIFYIENATSSAGGTALDALKTTPGVRVSNDAISISGKSSVLVLIDDKPTYLSSSELMNYLESLSVVNLSKIEVITTPPAKYEAEGNSGIINIVTKQIKQNSWNASLGATYQRSRRNTQQYNASYNLQKNKITLQTSMNYGLRRSLINWNNDIYYKDAFWQNESYSDANNKYVNGKIAFDYQISKAWKIGTKISASDSDFSDIGPQNTSIFDKKGGQIQQLLKNEAFSKDKTNQQVYNLYSEYRLDTLGKKISMDIDLVNYHSPTQRNFSYAQFTPSNDLIENSRHTGKNDVNIKIQNFSAKADIELPLPFLNLSAGTRFSQSQSKNTIIALNKNEAGEFIYDTNLSNYFEYTENNEAIYISANKKINEKWDIQTGLRLEATQTKGFSRETNNTHTKDYLKLFPTLYILRQFTEDTSIGLNYSRRIRRPSYESLNPFRTINNEFSYNEGNPFLLPSFTHNVELTYTYKKLDSRIYFSSERNGVNQASILNPETKENNYIWMNYVDSDSFGITETFTYKPTAWWTSVNTFDFNYSLSNIAISDKKYEGKSASFFTNNDFTLNSNKTLFLSVSYFQNFGETFQNFRMKPYAKFYATVKYLMLDKKLEMSISGSDIFNGREYSYQYISGITQEFKNIWDTQRIRFSLTYRFGNKNLNSNERQSGNSDELKRM